MIHFDLAWMEIPATYMTGGSLAEHYFLSQVSPSEPVFIAEPEVFVPEYLFPYYFLFFGVGIVPGSIARSFLTLVPIGQYQECRVCTQGHD